MSQDCMGMAFCNSKCCPNIPANQQERLKAVVASLVPCAEWAVASFTQALTAS